MPGTSSDIQPLDPRPFGAYRPSWLWRRRIGRQDIGVPAEVPEERVQRLRSLFQRKRPIFDITHGGVNLRLYPAENLCDRKFSIFGTHPVFDDIALARETLSRAHTVVDIGGNVGLYTLFARREMPADSRILVLEPDPRTVRKLRQNLDFNAADNVTLINVAVGARNETLTLYNASTKNVGRNTLKAHLAEEAEGRGVEVAVRPLIEVLAEQGIDRIDVLKIDVEGFEDQALGPFLETAPRSLLPGYIMIEVKSAPHWGVDLVERLLNLDYMIVHQTEDDMHFARASGGAFETPNSVTAR